MSEHALPAWTAIADLTGLAPGVTVLDVGCGGGGFCEVAAARGAEVHGLDAAPAEIARARRRVPNGDFQIGLMEELPWPDDTFDVVTGFNALQYALDLNRALSEAQRVSRPGGRLVICKWTRPERNEFFALLIAVDAARSASLHASDPIEDAVRRARLEIHDSGEVPVAIELKDATALESALVSAGALQSPCTDAERRELLDNASAFRRLDGSYRFRTGFGYVIART